MLKNGSSYIVHFSMRGRIWFRKIGLFQNPPSPYIFTTFLIPNQYQHRQWHIMLKKKKIRVYGIIVIFCIYTGKIIVINFHTYTCCHVIFLLGWACCNWCKLHKTNTYIWQLWWLKKVYIALHYSPGYVYIMVMIWKWQSFLFWPRLYLIDDKL